MIWTVAAAVAIALIGCASTDDVGNADEPTPPAAENDATATKPGNSATHSDDKDRPDFDPQFSDSGTKQVNTNDPTKDPTPPGGADSCIDNEDPGSSTNLAKALPETDDCDNDLKEVSGVANGGVDVDFYSVQATDKGVSTSHPFGCSLDTTFEAETKGTEMCVFARCRNNTDNAVTGCEGGTEYTDPVTKLKGCCAKAPGTATPKWDCSGVTDNDSADFFISVKQTDNGEQCLPYKFKYRF